MQKIFFISVVVVGSVEIGRHLRFTREYYLPIYRDLHEIFLVCSILKIFRTLSKIAKINYLAQNINKIALKVIFQ